MHSQYIRAAAEQDANISERGRKKNHFFYLQNKHVRIRLGFIQLVHQVVLHLSSSAVKTGAALILIRWSIQVYSSNRDINMSICSCVESCGFHEHEHYKRPEFSRRQCTLDQWRKSFFLWKVQSQITNTKRFLQNASKADENSLSCRQTPSLNYLSRSEGKLQLKCLLLKSGN